MLTGPRPDITPAQIGALVTFVASQAVAWGWLTPDNGQLAVSIGGTALASVWKLADAWLRGRRNAQVRIAPAPAQTTSSSSTTTVP